MDLQPLARNLADLLLPHLAPRFYATGTFTPAWAGTSTAGTFTYNTDPAATYGRWVRIFDMVYVTARVTITAITVAPVGNMRITGMSALPDPDSGAEYALSFGLISNMDQTAGYDGFTAWMINESSEARVSIREWRDNNTSAQWGAASFGNAAAACQVSGWYRATTS